MNKKDEVREGSLNDRIFARRVARELTPQELHSVGGGIHWTEATGAGDWSPGDRVSNPYADGYLPI